MTATYFAPTFFSPRYWGVEFSRREAALSPAPPFSFQASPALVFGVGNAPLVAPQALPDKLTASSLTASLTGHAQPQSVNP